MADLKVFGKTLVKDEDMPKLKIFGKEITEPEMRILGKTGEERRAARELQKASKENLSPTQAFRTDFSDEKMGPKYKTGKKESKKTETKEGERGSVDRTDEVKSSGPDMSKVNKEDAKSARELTATEKAQNLMSPGYNKKKGGMIKKMSSGGKVGSASRRADGCAMRGKTKGRII